MKITVSISINILCLMFSVITSGAQLEGRALLRAERTAVLSSQLAGQIVSMPARAKESFTSNAVLVEFDCRLQQAELKSANADLRAAILRRDNMERLSALSSISEVDVQLSRIEVENSEANVEAAEEMVRRCQMRAPYEGKVVRHLVNQYENVSDNTPIIEIIDNNALEVVVIAPQSWLRVLHQGAQFRFVPIGGEKTYSGLVSALPVSVDTASQTIEIIGQLNAVHQELLPGMNGTFFIEYE